MYFLSYAIATLFYGSGGSYLSSTSTQQTTLTGFVGTGAVSHPFVLSYGCVTSFNGHVQQSPHFPSHNGSIGDGSALLFRRSHFVHFFRLIVQQAR